MAIHYCDLSGYPEPYAVISVHTEPPRPSATDHRKSSNKSQPSNYIKIPHKQEPTCNVLHIPHVQHRVPIHPWQYLSTASLSGAFSIGSCSRTPCFPQKPSRRHMAAATTFYVQYAVHVVLVIKDNVIISTAII